MNSSAFMDKQIMDLMSNPQSQDDLSNGGGGGGTKKEEILPNYDFQPIRTFGFSEPAVNADIDAVKDSRRSWGSADSKIGSSTARYSNILEPHETAKINHENKRDTYDVATVLEVDRTVKKYADNLLHALEGVSTRLSQLESRTHHLENSVDELKTTIGNNSGSTDGKMRQLENILREVQTGVQVLRDKQEITEAQLQLAKLQHSSKPAPEPSNATSGQPDSQHYQQPPALPGPSYQSLPSQQPPPPSYQPPPPPPPLQPPPLYQPPPLQQPPPLPTPNAPPPPQPLPPYQPPPPQQQPPPLPTPNVPSPPQNQTSPYPAQLSQSLPRDPSYFPQPQTQTPPQPQPYQLPQYSQPMVNPPQLQPMPHHLEESASCMGSPLSQTYNPNARQSAPSAQPPPPGRPPQYYGPSGFSDGYSYSGSPSHYNSSMMKPSPFSNSPPSLGGLSNNNGGNYSRLPTAKILPQAAPTSTGPSSGGGGARLPIDDVVDKVATMGFSRDQVRATVRKLTENGQSVDLNVVLDKLMNEGAEMIQPQKGWFGR